MEQLHFNLLDAPWIPCVLQDGTLASFGIRETFAGAHVIREIVDPSPLVTASLHRLLLAVAHRVTSGPASIAEWAALWKQGAFAMEPYDRYFAQWTARFDLFDPEYPFYQWPGVDVEASVTVAKLSHELASGNNATLFDHTSDKQGSVFRPAEAARCLVTQQNYAVGGLVSLGAGEDARFKSAEAAPLARGALIVVKGSTLFETLLLNLVHYNLEKNLPFPPDSDLEDIPAWERTPPTTISERAPTGYLDLLTWQSRRLLLCPTQDADGAIVIARAVLMKGNQLDHHFVREDSETMQAFRKIEKPAAGQSPWLTIGFREDKALWRDSLALLQSIAGEKKRPKMLDWLDQLAERRIIERSRRVPLDLYGMTTDKAKVLFWRQDRLTVPLAYLQDQALQAALKDEIEKAEEVAAVLQASTRKLAQLLLSPNFEEGGREPAKQDVSNLVESFATGRLYWAQLEVLFHLLLVDLTAHPLPPTGIAPAAQQWRTVLRRAANAALAVVTNSMDGSARSLKAAVRAQRYHNGRLFSVLGSTQVEQGEGGSAA